MVKRTRLTLWITGDGFTLLADRSGDIAQVVYPRVNTEAPSADSITSLLRDARKQRERADLVVVLGYPDAHVRQLDALPTTNDATQIHEAVALDISRYFRARPEGNTLLGVWRGNDTWLAADASTSVLANIEIAARDAGVRLRFIVPSISVAAEQKGNGFARWQTSGVLIEAEIALGRAVRCRTRLVERESTTDAAEQPAISVSSEVAARSTGAFDPASKFHRQASWRRRRGIAVLAAVGLLIAWLGAPGLTALYRLQSAERDLLLLNATLAFAEDSLAAYSWYMARAGGIASFYARNGAELRELSAITAALPDGAAMLSLDMDTSAVRVVILAPEGASILPGAQVIPGWDAAALLGPITRESVNGSTFERAAIELRRLAEVAPDAR